MVFGGFLERRIPGKNGEANLRIRTQPTRCFQFPNELMLCANTAKGLLVAENIASLHVCFLEVLHIDLCSEDMPEQDWSSHSL